jgi:DNA polymerase-3 subunit gamma/tau
LTADTEAAIASPAVAATAEPACLPPETAKSATILSFPAVAPSVPEATPSEPLENGHWSPEAWSRWVLSSDLSGMALNLARHVLLVGKQSGDAVLELSPRHEIMANRALETLLARLRQDFPAMNLQRESREPSGLTPLEIEQERQRLERAAARDAFLADGMVQALIRAFDADLVEETLIVGEKR